MVKIWNHDHDGITIQQKSTMADANINNFRELIKLQRQKILNILISCVLVKGMT